MYQKLITLLKSSSAYAAGNVFNRMLFLISMPILTRYLAPKEYGILSLVNAVIAIMGTLYGLAVHDFAMRFYYEYNSERERKRLLGTIFTFIIVVTLIISLFLSAWGDLLFPRLFKEVPFYPYMLLGIWICFIGMLEIIPDALFRIKNQALLLISINLAKSILGITLSIIAVVVLQRGSEGPLGASLIVAILAGCYYLFYIKDKIFLNFSFKIIKQCLRFSLPIVFLLLGRVLLDSTDRLMLQWFVDLSVVAFYSVGATIGSALVMIAGSIDTAWAPFFYSTAKEENENTAKQLFSYASIYLGTIIIFLSLCVTVFRHEIIYILAPPSYYPIISIIPYIMIAATLNGLFFIPVRGIYQQKKTVWFPVIILTSLIVNIFFNLIFIPKYNMLGAAYATIIASMVMFTMCYFISQKFYFVPYQNLRFAKVLFACALCYLLSLPIHNFPLLISFILKFLVIGLFPVFLYLVKFFEVRETDTILKIVHTVPVRLRELISKKK